ncbi:MAG: hypothetical protein U0746_10130 [Gemmataceae bacterium]
MVPTSIPNFGWHHLPLEIQAVLAALPRPYFADTAAHLLAAPPDGDVYLWEACRRVTGGHLPAHDQDGVGCCVGEGFSAAVEYLQCVEIALKNEAEAYSAISCESIYALSRVEVGGGRIDGDGSTGAWAAKAVQDYGMLPRKVFGSVDLTAFSPQRAREWGDAGLPRDLEPEARKHPVKTVSLVKSFDEALAALANGYPVAVCSDQGFAMTRDRDGFCSPQGSWAHCMCFVGATAGKRPGLCCLQSWGPTTPGGPVGLGDHPRNAFWVDAQVCDRMLGQGDSWALSAFEGFPARRLDWLL